ncbi:hypothetical protein SAMN05216281_102210 [Cryobacterium luteum]|nr:hypothetical protein SAMN05216281_102210 [Cryobacterium luteum]
MVKWVAPRVVVSPGGLFALSFLSGPGPGNWAHDLSWSRLHNLRPVAPREAPPPFSDGARAPSLGPVYKLGPSA